MITDVPSADDFRVYGLRYLNMGWGQALHIGLEILDLDEYAFSEDKVGKADFARRAEPEIATALTLVAQGAEFLLKAKIAAVSPWLLLSRNSDGWPKLCDQKDVPFAEFHTIDAQDLVKIHDTFCQPRLSEEFRQVFRELRRKRNAMMHTVDFRLQTTLTEIIEHVLVVADVLTVPGTWPIERSLFLEISRDSAIDADAVAFLLAREFLVVTEKLTPAKLQRHFGLPPKRRMYLCPVCRHSYEDSELEARTAVLQPNTPQANEVYCFVCRTSSAVTRDSCAENDCKGNVLDPERDECLACGKNQK